jgi:hypothetical protein
LTSFLTVLAIAFVIPDDDGLFIRRTAAAAVVVVPLSFYGSCYLSGKFIASSATN